MLGYNSIYQKVFIFSIKAFMKRLSLLSMILLAVLAPLACSKTFTLAPLSLTPTPNVTFTPTSTPTVTATLTPIGAPTWTPSPTYKPTPPVFDFAFGTAGNGNGQFNSSIQGPTGIAVDSSGMIYVTDYGNRRVEKFNPSGTYLTQWTGYTSVSYTHLRAHETGRNL